ncbi:hypothetical protein [Streptomyces sp. NBC_01594]|uniref:hypothetical protein n=1 Tax=Streptomyces sp. NBC_01594 TaxID=2975890 RepID=UPI003869959B
MLGLVIILAIAWTLGSAVHNAFEGVRKDYRKRVKKAKKAKHRKAEAKKRAGRKTKPAGKSSDWGVKAGAFAGTTLVGALILTRDFGRGLGEGWPKGKARAEKWHEHRKAKKAGTAAPAGSTPPASPPTSASPTPAPAPASTTAKPDGTAPAAAPKPSSPHLKVVPDPETSPSTDTPSTTTTAGGTSMAITKIGEVLNVSSLKRALAQIAAESTTNEEEATEIESRAAQMLGAIETVLEQATTLEFDSQTLAEIAALRDAITAQLTGARNYLASAADGASVALDAANNVHKRHGGIAEAVAAAPAAMAKREAYAPE